MGRGPSSFLPLSRLHLVVLQTRMVWYCGMRRGGAWCILGIPSPASSWSRWVVGCRPACLPHGLAAPARAGGSQSSRQGRAGCLHPTPCAVHSNTYLPTHLPSIRRCPYALDGSHFLQAGQGCTLLIHEATFEPCLQQQARQKRHSTTAEALEVAQVWLALMVPC